jgi:hypothetical protein
MEGLYTTKVLLAGPGAVRVVMRVKSPPLLALLALGGEMLAQDPPYLEDRVGIALHRV